MNNYLNVFLPIFVGTEAPVFVICHAAEESPCPGAVPECQFFSKLLETADVSRLGRQKNRTDNFLYQLMDKNKVTCLKNSVEYIFKSHCSEKNHVPLYWCKVFELNDIMHNRRDIDMIMWLDSDAFFTSYEKMNPHKLESLHPGFAMWVSGDAPPLHFDKFNAGSFLLKNDDRGRSIIRNWKGQYDASRWSFNDGAWTTDGAWAGRDYEQGSFAENIMDSEEWSHMICKLPYYVFNEVNCDEPNEYLSTLRAITRCNTRMHA